MFVKSNLKDLAMSAAFALLAACGSDGGDGSGDLKFPEQQREATLNFSSPADVFLLTVYSTPATSEASPAADVLYEIAPAAQTSGLRVNRAPKALTLGATIDHAYWNARLAVEKQRRDGIDRLAADLAARKQSLRLVDRQALRAACDCPDSQTCTPGTSTCVDSVTLTLAGASREMDVVGNVTSPGGVKITVLGPSGVSGAALTSVASEFGVAADTVLEVMGQDGHVDELDVDGSESITIAFTNNFGSLPSSVVGVFVFGDYLASGESGATGNRSDILWARLPEGANTEALIIGTLAHEYQHLVSFALRSKLGDPAELRETLWLDEGLAHLMEDLTGWGGSTVDAYALALEQWDSAPFAGPNDTVAQRGRAYTLLRYLIDARVRAAGQNSANSPTVITQAHDLLAPLYTQTRRGFQHALMQDARNDGRVVNWLRAVYATSNSDATALPTETTPRFLAVASSTQANGQWMGFNPFHEYVDARGQDVPLAGPGGVDDSNDSGFTEVSDSIVSSGARYYLVTGGDGSVTVNLTADNASDINIDAVKVR